MKTFNDIREAVPDSKADLMLEVGKIMILKQPKDDYDRGILVRLNEDGSYSMAYWANEAKPYPVEILVDGVSVKKDAKIVKMAFHPDPKEKEDD